MPLLQTIDWQGLYGQGVGFESWLEQASNPENSERMKEILTQTAIPQEHSVFLGALPRDVFVVAFAEHWCADVIRHTPVLAKMERIAPKLHLRFVNRTANLHVFVRFLTNGGESIPKFVFLSDGWVECGNWGPMDQPCRELIARGKAAGDLAAARVAVAARYAADPECRTMLSEIVQILDIAACTRVGPEPGGRD